MQHKPTHDFKPMKPFDPTKPVQTRDGRKARILAHDIKRHRYPIASAIELNNGLEQTVCHTEDGYFYDTKEKSINDLINTPQKIKVEFWANVYQDGHCSLNTSRKEADSFAGKDRLACFLVTREIEEGEGL